MLRICSAARPGGLSRLCFRIRQTALVVALLAFPLLAPSLQAEDDFADSALGRELINLGLKFLDNPGDFFFNLHSDNEDFSPLPGSSHGSLRFNFFPTFLPVTWGNLSGKVKIFNERRNMPQIDLAFTYGDLLALRAFDSGDARPQFNDYAVGAVVSKAMDDTTRLFGGVKYSAVNMHVSFSTPVVMGAFQTSAIDFQISDVFLLTGITHQTKPDSAVVAQIGYGFKYNKIVSRIMLSRKHLELGMDIYPEGLFVVHPFMAWHWYY